MHASSIMYLGVNLNISSTTNLNISNTANLLSYKQNKCTPAQAIPQQFRSHVVSSLNIFLLQMHQMRCIRSVNYTNASEFGTGADDYQFPVGQYTHDHNGLKQWLLLGLIISYKQMLLPNSAVHASSLIAFSSTRKLSCIIKVV
jgi:hypothetical protein